MKILSRLILLMVMLQVLCSSCGKTAEAAKAAPVFKSSIPAHEATDVPASTAIEVVFDEVISLAINHGVTINDEPANVKASFTKLMFSDELQSNTNYTIIIPKGAVINSFDVPLEEAIEITFTTKEEYVPNTETMQFVAQMGVGWNLGNTLDTKDADETMWGNPLAQKELIDAIRAKGFKTLRVPVTWQYHMGDAPDYIIEESWLNRVKEVVNYGLDNDMYVIVNIHHDEEWVIPAYDHLDAAKEQLAKVWTQIANHLKAYDEHLVFETLNETRLKGSAEEWTGGTAEGRDCINQFHQVAVKAIRATGGNNSERYIMISPYAASSSEVALTGLVLPADKNLIVSVHNYFPYKFALAETDYVTSWGTDADKQALDAELDRLVSLFINKDIAVVMGEWGSLNHDNLTHRKVHAAYFAQGCLERGICPIWWDNGSSDYFGLIDRHTYQWVFPEIADAIINAQ
ncbi:cellulase family glycosylhydrolase [Carboxylicivirga sediminis]|uniref:Cellulase family glycosylhydrolase n=1 Tax=Carboxylicivirga sediminis TaxID=2006564 RepID=A0A941EZH8_9BACT|nr:cellulase family glycosylhydrolase [Carboxylicivirga sediminis]MBR8534054.1 cellulase family glycosylhydrolase [Carboxylicivirga sediminis]